MTDHSSSTPPELVLIGYTLKTFGLKGELKVKPESSNLNRHEMLSTVYFKKTEASPVIPLTVSKSRLHQGFWFLTFKNRLNPEAVREFSGGLLFVSREDRVPLPQNQVYISDIIGFQAVDEFGKMLGHVTAVKEQGIQDLIVIHQENNAGSATPPHEEILIPWVKAFVEKIDTESQTIHILFDRLKGLYEN